MNERIDEPVAWMTINAYGDEDDIWYENPEGKLLKGWTYKPLYTTPQQRKPLTVQEIAEFVGTNEYGAEQLKWFRFGEAAHGIKEKNT